MDDNPWLVPNLDEFLFYNCPECNLKTKQYDMFFKHAVNLHPKAKVLEKQMLATHLDIKEEEMSEDECSDQLENNEDKEKAFQKCQKTWKDFLSKAKIQKGKEPTKEDFVLYFKLFRQTNLRDQDFKEKYAHLKKMYKIVFNKEMMDFPGESFQYIIKQDNKCPENVSNIHQKTWKQFLTIAKVNPDQEPTKKDFETYFQHLKDKNLFPNTIKTRYCHLNKMLQFKYKKKLTSFPGTPLLSYIDMPLKDDKRFTKAQLIQFWKEADDSNRVLLVRKVIAMLAYLGGLKLSMLKKLTLGSVKPHPNGYAVYIERNMTMSQQLNEPEML